MKHGRSIRKEEAGIPMEPMESVVTFGIYPAWERAPREILEYWNEFADYDEWPTTLYLMEKMTAAEWLEYIRKDDHTLVTAFTVNGKLVGIGRITPDLRCESQGKMGYAIRPTERGKGYAAVFVHMMERVSEAVGVEHLTAVIDTTNERSIRAFLRAGWKCTGRKFEWNPNKHHPQKRIAVEMEPIPKG